MVSPDKGVNDKTWMLDKYTSATDVCIHAKIQTIASEATRNHIAAEEKAMTNAQKRKRVESVLDGPGGDRLSNRQAAALAGVSHHLVHLVRQERAMQK
ncbi:hypothetical protein CJNNKLLH_2255 [Methylorubrum thiocyanatum]|nr:hypothetical protein CJNNKLLH_2255 [Methylorubrum thiocyanatum]